MTINKLCYNDPAKLTFGILMLFCLVAHAQPRKLQGSIGDGREQSPVQELNQEISTGQAVLCAASILCGYGNITNRIHIKCIKDELGHRIEFFSMSVDGSVQIKMASVLVAYDGRKVLVQNTKLFLHTISDGDKGVSKTFVDRAIMCALSMKQDSLSNDFVLDWRGSPNRVVVDIAKIPQRPGDDCTIIINKGEACLFPGL